MRYIDAMRMNDCLRLVVTSRLQEPVLGLLGDAVLSLLFSLLDRCRLPVSSSITDHPYQQQQCPSDPVQTLVGHVNHHRVDYSSNRQIGTKSYKTQALYRSHRPVDRACIPNTAQSTDSDTQFLCTFLIASFNVFGALRSCKIFSQSPGAASLTKPRIAA
jgi:hypothetical protein